MTAEGVHWAAIIHAGRGPVGYTISVPDPASILNALLPLPLVPVAAAIVPVLPPGAPLLGLAGGAMAHRCLHPQWLRQTEGYRLCRARVPWELVECHRRRLQPGPQGDSGEAQREE